MKLSDLLKGIGQYEIKGGDEVTINGLELDSRLVTDKNLFAAIKGSAVDGHRFISSAIQKGAVAILCESWPEDEFENVTIIRADDSRLALAKMAANFYDHPSKKMKCVGITGTNGKTTIATLLYNLSKGLGYAVGLISTIEILVKEERIPTTMTTPDIITMHRLLSEMVSAGCSHVFMEVSSHAIDQLRIAEIEYAGGVFTNITHDHLDYHGSFKAYIKVKQLFFTGLSSSSFALTNVDDKNGGVMLEKAVARKLGYSLRTITDYKSKILSQDKIGTFIEINNQQLSTRLVGDFNIYNLTAVYAVASELEIAAQDELLVALSGLSPIKGRLELVSHEPQVFVDYAHTPDALENVLETIRNNSNVEQVITVAGCGGDRDKAKRPLMRIAACKYSDRVILTSDNPRSENPDHILSDMMENVSPDEEAKIIKITDRKAAIQTALAIAGKDDTILIAGKGHEEYQEINGERFFFSDQKIVKDILSKDI